jgi:RecA/RadA recombinase
MPVVVTGKYPILTRQSTGLFSLDLAVADRSDTGWPMRTITEIYGHPNSGKSTLAYYLSSVLGRNGKVVILDLEFLNRKYIQKMYEASKFDGEVQIIDSVDIKKKGRPHEAMLTDFKLALLEPGTRAGVWDSLSQVVPVGELTGDFGEANWGQRAKLNNQVSRALGGIIRNKDAESVIFGVNHTKGVMGGRGHTTPGGDDFKDIATVRMMLWTKKVWTISDDDKTPIGFEVKGQIEKLRFGGRGRTFQFYIVPGYGVHVGASAMFDCFEYELADQGATVKVDGRSLGYIRKDLLFYALSGKERKFTVFREKLEHYGRSIKENDDVAED